VDLERSAKLDLTGLEPTGQFVPAQLGIEEIHLYLAQEENVSMTVSVHWTGLALITIVDLHAQMLVDKMLNARREIMEPFAHVLQVLLGIH